MIGLTQLGIDNYGIIHDYYDGGRIGTDIHQWGSNGGHGSGRKFPILFRPERLPNRIRPGISPNSFCFRE